MGKASKQVKAKPPKTSYAIAIGSNQSLSRRLGPAAIIAAACNALDAKPVKVKAIAPVVRSRPLGPSLRDYANSALLVRTRLTPPELLDRLQAVEALFGRRRQRRWGSRTLDLDIILWEGGIWQSPRLTIPHPAFRRRDFVLGPLRAMLPDWRDPVSGLSIAHLAARHARPKPVDPSQAPR